MLRRQLLTGLAAGAGAIAATATARPALAAEAPATGPRFVRRRDMPNIEMIDHTGARYRFFDDLVKGKTLMVNFMYVECTGICPTQTANLKRVYDLFGGRVGRDIHMYSITLRPADDRPDDLAHYVDMHETGPGWKFLTGDPDEVEGLRRHLGFVDRDPAVDALKESHIGMVRYGSEPLNRWGAAPAASRPELLVYNLLSMIEPVQPLLPDVVQFEGAQG